MTPIDYAIWGTGTAVGGAVVAGAGAKAQKMQWCQGLERSAQTVEMRVDIVKLKLKALQKTIDKKHPHGMTDEQAQAFYMNRRAEFAQLGQELKAIKQLADAGDAECAEVIRIAQERASHWRLTLFLTDNCPIL